MKTLLFTSLVLFVLTRFFIFGMAYTWQALEPRPVQLGHQEPIWHGDRGGHGAAAEPWRRWDALWFMKTAREGYSFTPGRQCNTTIFPLYPMVMSWLARAGMDLVWAGIVVSNMALLAAVMLLLHLAWPVCGGEGAVRGVTALLMFPPAFVLSGVYSESLFLLAVLGAFSFARQRAWAEAGLCGFAAALTRFTGVLLLLPLLWEFFSKRGEREPRARALWLLALVVAPFVFFCYLQVSTGSFWDYFHAAIHWDKAFAWPWVGLGWEVVGWTWDFGRVMNVGSVILFLCLAVAVWKEFGGAWGLYVFLGVLAPVCASRWIGMPRYMIVLFPAFLYIGKKLRPGWFYGVYLPVSAMLMIWCFRLYANWNFSL